MKNRHLRLKTLRLRQLTEERNIHFTNPGKPKPRSQLERIDMLLKDKVAIITGGAGQNGLGFATARLMAAHGARVAVLDLERADPQAAAAQLGTGHLGIVADVTDKASCDAAAAAVLKALGRIDVLVNNAGITQPVKTLDITGADYDRILDVSLRGTLYMSQAVLPAMQKQKGGSIICISSVSAQRGGGILGGPHYSAAKAGVLGLARAMAREFGPEGIRVNSITPGLIGTDIIKGKLTEDKKAEIAETIPLARLGRAEDIGGACVFLASELAAYCTGVTLDVNGGMLIH
jgi:NAD(P)-dependent dehydrogenase (short-subunit alcohol dehydrogenase family)